MDIVTYYYFETAVGAAMAIFVVAYGVKIIFRAFKNAFDNK